MTTDDIVKLALGLVLAFSILGISIQIMRLLGTFNLILLDVRGLAAEVAELIMRVKTSFGNLENTLAGVGRTIDGFNQGFLQPISNFASTIGNLATLAREKLVGNDES